MGKDRLHGLSLLRTISMFGIIGLHVLNVGGVFDRVNLLTMHQVEFSVLYMLFAGSVNTFAMLTGYLYVDKPAVKYKNILKLIFTVAFYSALITIIFIVFKRDVFYSAKDLLKALCPPLVGKFWYITCYVLLFVLIPFINKLINNLSIRQFKVLLILLLIFTSVLPTFFMTDFFKIDNGYSTAWLIVCYLIGAYIKRSNIKASTRKLSLIYLFCVIITVVLTAVGCFALKRLVVYNALSEYISPFIVVMSGVSIVLFSRINLKNGFLIKIIDSFSNCSFDAYIIHSHILIYDYLIQGNFAFIKNLNPILTIPAVLVSIIGIYVVCWLIGLFKSLLFRVVRIDVMFDNIGQRIDCLLEKN